MSASSLRASLANIRSRSRINEAEARRSGAALAAGFTLGAMEKAGTLAQVPDMFGLPKTVTIAIVSKLAAGYASGDMSDYANGVGDAAGVVALYQFGKGETVDGMVAGATPPRLAGSTQEVGARRLTASELRDFERRLEDKLRRRGAIDGATR